MRLWHVLLIFTIVGSCIFTPALNNPFLFDDEEQILNNSAVVNFDVLSILGSSTFNSGGAVKASGIYYKPIMTLYYGAIYSLFGPQPIAFRVPILALHILSAFLLFLLFRGFFGVRLALAFGIIFLIHPVNAEVVLYIAAAQDTLYMFFGLLALYLVHRNTTRVNYFALTICLSLSLLSKETGSLFLILTAAFTYWFRPKLWRPVTTVSVAITAVYGVIRLSLGLTGVASHQLEFHRASFGERLMTVPSALWHYIELYFFPWRLSLTTDYVIREFTVRDFWLPLVGVILFVFLLTQIGKRIKEKEQKAHFKFFSLALLLWFLLHGQVLVPLDGVYTDRWGYLAILALTGIIVTFLKDKVWIHEKAVATGLVVICILLSARSYWRGLDWRSGLDLYQAELYFHPNDALMNNNLGVELFRKGDFVNAKKHIEKSVKINPLWATSLSNLGALNEHFQELDDALAHYEKSMAVGDYSLAYENYAKLLMRLNRPEKCYEFLTKQALPRYPNNPILQAIYKTLAPPSQ